MLGLITLTSKFIAWEKTLYRTYSKCNVENLIDAVKATEDLIPQSSEYASMIENY